MSDPVSLLSSISENSGTGSHDVSCSCHRRGGGEPDEYQRIDAESGGVSWVKISDPDPATILLSAPLEGDEETILCLTSGG